MNRASARSANPDHIARGRYLSGPLAATANEYPVKKITSAAQCARLGEARLLANLGPERGLPCHLNQLGPLAQFRLRPHSIFTDKVMQTISALMATSLTWLANHRMPPPFILRPSSFVLRPSPYDPRLPRHPR